MRVSCAQSKDFTSEIVMFERGSDAKQGCEDAAVFIIEGFRGLEEEVESSAHSAEGFVLSFTVVPGEW